MANFSVNQFRHLYVVKNLLDKEASATNEGDIVPGLTSDNKKMYFTYKGKGGIVRTDLIDMANILWATSKTSMPGRYARTLSVEFKSGSAPVAGQMYILKIKYNQFIGMSDEDNYFEYGEVRATNGMSASDFWVKMALSLAKNTAKQKMVKVYMSDDTEVLPTMKEADLSGTYTGIYIMEIEQPWVLGTRSSDPVVFDVFCTPVIENGEDDVLWAEITDTTATNGDVIGNGKTIADLEYFCMGERGDIYRNVGWPNTIRTEYMVDPTKMYDVFTIHYAYVGPNEGPQKSERDLVLVVEHSTEEQSVSAELLETWQSLPNYIEEPARD